MQFTKIASVLAMAAAAIAAPAPGNYESSNVCCNGLGCLVQILGAGCATTSYCCQSNSPLAVGALININALNCVKVL
ncbi:hypothetical protein H9Q69_009823 [Fusarium xylarioides]|nr:hypothetical protein H9Q69_009823 [Fusarium xylarioides]